MQPYAYPPLFQGYPQDGQPQYGQLQYGQPPQYAPAVAPKSTGVGLVLGLLLPGVGCMYAGRPGIGVLLLVAWLISIPLILVLGIGFITGVIVWIASAVLGYTMTREWNAAHGIVS
jgi:TM2 domain-containing membrane protein YozV